MRQYCPPWIVRAKDKNTQSLATFGSPPGRCLLEKLVRNDICFSTKGMINPAIPRGAGRRYCAPERFHPTNVRIEAVSRGTQRSTTWAACGTFLWASTLLRSWCTSSRNDRCNRTSGESRGTCLPVWVQNSVSYVKISNG